MQLSFCGFCQKPPFLPATDICGYRAGHPKNVQQAEGPPPSCFSTGGVIYRTCEPANFGKEARKEDYTIINSWKRLLSGLLALVLVVGMLPTATWAQADVTEPEQPEPTEAQPSEEESVSTEAAPPVPEQSAAAGCDHHLHHQGGTEKLKVSFQNGKLFETVLNDDGKVALTLKEGIVYATNKSYKVQLDMTVCGKTVSKAVTVKVSQTALKVTSPVTAQIGKVTLGSKTTAAFRNALGDESNLSLNPATGRVDLPLESPGLLTPGKSYTLYLAVTPKNAATNVAPVQIKLTVKVKG